MKSLNYLAPICRTGYGVAGGNILTQLVERQIEVAYHPIGNVEFNSKEVLDTAQQCLNNGRMFDYDAPSLKLWHQFDLAGTVGRGKYYAFPIFELDQFSEQEKHHLAYPDELITTSQWGKDILLSEIPGAKVSVVPLGVDTNIFHSFPAQKTSDSYIFLSAGKWEIRKGHDILVEAFNKAFAPKDNVLLLMMTFNPFLSSEEHNEWARMYTDSPMGDKILIQKPVNTQYDVANIMNQVDCGLFASRAEGWNLELLEMMAMNRPVITTVNSAMTEFCNEDNCFGIKTPEMEDAFDGKWFNNQGRWAKITADNIDQMVELMRRCYEERPENPAGVKTAKQFSWANTVNHLEKVIWE